MSEPTVDGATVEVVRSHLASAAEEMRAALVRTAFNPVIYEVYDFGISIYDRQLRLVAESTGLSRFLGANDYSIERGVEYVGRENLHPGDVVLLNYPYWNAAHSYDATLFAPVFLPSGEELIGFLCIRAHWMDLGAKDPGYVLDSTDMHQEGIIFPGTKVYARGKPVREIHELIRFNSRMPELVLGDLNAQIAALRTGERRVIEVYRQYGPAVVDAVVERVIAAAADSAHEAVAGLPQGSWTAEDWLDDDGVTGDPIRMRATVTVAGGTFTVDFTGSSPAVPGPVNLPLGATIATCRVAFKAVTTPTQQTNAGHFAPLRVRTEPGSLFHARYPAATFTQWTGTVALELIYQALAQGMPERLPASSGGDVPGFMMVGLHPDTGQMFAVSNNDPVGWGGTPHHDGIGPANHLCQTQARNTPVEVLEARTGMFFERVEIRTDSGGAGRFRGGCGLRRDIRFVTSGEFLSVIKKTKSAPWALAGGLRPDPNQVVVFPGTDREQRVSTRRTSVRGGDRVTLLTAGGGGHGDPRTRDPDAVRRDVAEGYVSAQAARELYGVIA
ncbi:hydantoinase B/oxoprolinase family protein [Micromonospora sp. DR5-3]|uniref:hydantoinase B/oxoprolinase family protein n=1 Tax=unclassified Micromonospora TaxID=2617518 RepID=UPI0011D36A51|nr:MULTISPECIES: hydantoinase B/oxoprolinase family protein [unclassified Micromonospora]MCW3815732.1 hydantoinase B/oxoprolinase family protein [Micromonospora sp. DR5-3]TYC19797.1 hydantoinase B/oxoprolinase family protein [Micromonospora sp. MP36]